MLPEERAFLVRGEDNLEYGPVGLDELREWVRENRAGLGTEARRDETGASWQPWHNYPELVALLAEVRGSRAAWMPGPEGRILAPVWRRMVASFLDLFLSYILASPIICVVLLANVPDCQEQFKAMLLDPQVQPSPLLYHYMLRCIVIWYAILLLYMVGFHALHGRTPGKSVLRLQVVDEKAGKPGLSKLALRGLVFVLSVYAYGIPLACVFLNPQRRAPHDFVAGTWVVRR